MNQVVNTQGRAGSDPIRWKTFRQGSSKEHVSPWKILRNTVEKKCFPKQKARLRRSEMCMEAAQKQIAGWVLPPNKRSPKRKEE